MTDTERFGVKNFEIRLFVLRSGGISENRLKNRESYDITKNGNKSHAVFRKAPGTAAKWLKGNAGAGEKRNMI